MATGKSLEEYIKEQEDDFQEKNAKMEKRKTSFQKKSIIFGSVFLALLLVLFVIDFNTRDRSYEALKNTRVTDSNGMAEIAASSELLGHTDLYEKYEAACLGNKGSHAMNYGLLAENQYGYISMSGQKETILNVKGKETILSKKPISQINITSDSVIYRGADKKLYKSRHDGSKKTVIVEDKVGTVLSVGQDVYFVNYTEENNLYKYNLKEEKLACVLKEDIKTFTVAADTILYLDYENCLHSVSLDGAPHWTLDQVDKFYFNGRIFVQNNDKVISFNLNKHDPKDVVSGVSELLGVDAETVYYSVKNKVYAYNMSEDKTTELPYSFDYFKGVYKIDGKIIVLGGTISET